MSLFENRIIQITNLLTIIIGLRPNRKFRLAELPNGYMTINNIIYIQIQDTKSISIVSLASSKIMPNSVSNANNK